MQKLIETLMQLEADHSIRKPGRKWEVKKPPKEIVFPDDCTTGFDQNIHLKHNLNALLNTDEDLAHHLWIINTWGGIGSFKLTIPNERILRSLRSQLATGVLTDETMNVIASVSKIASFYDPIKYTIYDSRAIYTLNWLILKHCPGMELFPQPQGRSASVSFDMQTLLSLSGHTWTEVPRDNAYFRYCELVKKLAGEVYGDRDKPYFLEMLLFVNTEVIQADIKATVKVSFPFLENQVKNNPKKMN